MQLSPDRSQQVSLNWGGYRRWAFFEVPFCETALRTFLGSKVVKVFSGMHQICTTIIMLDFRILHRFVHVDDIETGRVDTASTNKAMANINEDTIFQSWQLMRFPLRVCGKTPLPGAFSPAQS